MLRWTGDTWELFGEPVSEKEIALFRNALVETYADVLRAIARSALVPKKNQPIKKASTSGAGKRFAAAPPPVTTWTKQSLKEFRSDARGRIAVMVMDAYLQASGKTFSKLTPEEFKTVTHEIETQHGYLDGMVESMKDGKLTSAQVEARIAMYAGVVVKVWEKGKADQLNVTMLAYPGQMANNGAFDPSLIIGNGKGCAGGQNCRCWWETSVAKDGVVTAIWHTADGDACHWCLSKAAGSPYIVHPNGQPVTTAPPAPVSVAPPPTLPGSGMPWSPWIDLGDVPAFSKGSTYEGIVLYHLSPEADVQKKLDKGLVRTDGMFGNAVYLQADPEHSANAQNMKSSKDFILPVAVNIKNPLLVKDTMEYQDELAKVGLGIFDVDVLEKYLAITGHDAVILSKGPISPTIILADPERASVIGMGVGVPATMDYSKHEPKFAPVQPLTVGTTLPPAPPTTAPPPAKKPPAWTPWVSPHEADAFAAGTYYEQETLYHFAPGSEVQDIIDKGITTTKDGMHGQGIYLNTDPGHVGNVVYTAKYDDAVLPVAVRITNPVTVTSFTGVADLYTANGIDMGGTDALNKLLATTGYDAIIVDPGFMTPVVLVADKKKVAVISGGVQKPTPAEYGVTTPAPPVAAPAPSAPASSLPPKKKGKTLLVMGPAGAFSASPDAPQLVGTSAMIPADAKKLGTMTADAVSAGMIDYTAIMDVLPDVYAGHITPQEGYQKLLQKYPKFLTQQKEVASFLSGKTESGTYSQQEMTEALKAAKFAYFQGADPTQWESAKFLTPGKTLDNLLSFMVDSPHTTMDKAVGTQVVEALDSTMFMTLPKAASFYGLANIEELDIYPWTLEAEVGSTVKMPAFIVGNSDPNTHLSTIKSHAALSDDALNVRYKMNVPAGTQFTPMGVTEDGLDPVNVLLPRGASLKVLSKKKTFDPVAGWIVDLEVEYVPPKTMFSPKLTAPDNTADITDKPGYVPPPTKTTFTPSPAMPAIPKSAPSSSPAPSPSQPYQPYVPYQPPPYVPYQPPSAPSNALPPAPSSNAVIPDILQPAGVTRPPSNPAPSIWFDKATEEGLPFKSKVHDDADLPGTWSVREAHEESKRMWEGLLSREQREAVLEYSGGGFTPVNKSLRQGKIDEPGRGSLRETVWHLDRALEQSEARRDFLSYRGIGPSSPLHSSHDLVVGEIVEDAGYASTSLEYNVAEGFAYGQGPDGEVVYVVVPEYSAGGYLNPDLTQYEFEREWLLPRGTHFQVIGRSQKGNVIVELLPWEDPLAR